MIHEVNNAGPATETLTNSKLISADFSGPMKRTKFGSIPFPHPVSFVLLKDFGVFSPRTRKSMRRQF